MTKMKVTFKRKGTFTMEGGAEIEMEGRDYGELYMKGCKQQFTSYLPADIKYDDEDWQFDFLEQQEYDPA